MVWYACYSKEDGREFYFQPETNKTTWTKPENADRLERFEDSREFLPIDPPVMEFGSPLEPPSTSKNHQDATEASSMGSQEEDLVVRTVSVDDDSSSTCSLDYYDEDEDLRYRHRLFVCGIALILLVVNHTVALAMPTKPRVDMHRVNATNAAGFDSELPIAVDTQSTMDVPEVECDSLDSPNTVEESLASQTVRGPMPESERVEGVYSLKEDRESAANEVVADSEIGGGEIANDNESVPRVASEQQVAFDDVYDVEVEGEVVSTEGDSVQRVAPGQQLEAETATNEANADAVEGVNVTTDSDSGTLAAPEESVALETTPNEVNHDEMEGVDVATDSDNDEIVGVDVTTDRDGETFAAPEEQLEAETATNEAAADDDEIVGVDVTTDSDSGTLAAPEKQLEEETATNEAVADDDDDNDDDIGGVDVATDYDSGTLAAPEEQLASDTVVIGKQVENKEVLEVFVVPENKLDGTIDDPPPFAMLQVEPEGFVEASTVVEVGSPPIFEKAKQVIQRIELDDEILRILRGDVIRDGLTYICKLNEYPWPPSEGSEIRLCRMPFAHVVAEDCRNVRATFDTHAFVDSVFL